MPFETLLIPALFMLGSFFLSSLQKSLALLPRLQIKRLFSSSKKKYFFYYLIQKIFGRDPWSGLHFISQKTNYLTRIFYAVSACWYVFSQHDSPRLVLDLCIIVVIGLMNEFVTGLFAEAHPSFAIRSSFVISSFFLFIFSPITFLLYQLQELLLPKKEVGSSKQNSLKLKDKLLEFLHETEPDFPLDSQDKRLILSIASFRDRIAREVMVPRIDVSHLPAEELIHKAAQKFVLEGYSRTPVFRNSIDNIVGVLHYKDVLQFYVQYYDQKGPSPFDTAIDFLLKPIVYTPETKKISMLLQEFKNKQMHLAIVVDEYGGTEGIVTIEDILEELVGEIADEYDDIKEEIMFTTDAENGWIVDAKMNIIDIQKELFVNIPESPEYDTIGGYIYQRAGAIPTPGWKIHHENFDLEILSSTERSIDKIRIIPTKNEDRFTTGL